MLFPDSALGVDGIVMATLTGTPTGVLQGQAYVGTYPLVSATPDATDAWLNGFRYSTAGALRIYDASAGLPANTSSNQGITMSSTGLACVNIAAVGSDVVYVNGVPVTNDGRIYMDTSN
jgi:hypothetical protein